MELPPLKTLPVFEAVARLNGFSRAAEALNISQSAVSHRIRQLEDHLGETLFIRGGRHMELTPEGERYLEAVAPALARIERASRALRGQPGTRLRLAVPGSFAVRWLIPRLHLFNRAHPDLELSMEMLSDMPPMSERLADCFIAISPSQRGYLSECLYRERLFPIASPGLGETLRRSRGTAPDGSESELEPADLAGYPLLSATSIFERQGEDWRRYFRASGLDLPTAARLHVFSHMLLAHEAARHHQGIALSNDYMVDTEVDSDLVRLPGPSFATGDEFHFAYKSSRRNEPAIRRLRDWLMEQARRSGLSEAARSSS